MGYDQNNAEIHLIPRGYKGNPETFQPFDKYGAIIAENHMKKEYTDQKILEDVKLCNFISLADKRGQLKEETKRNQKGAEKRSRIRVKKLSSEIQHLCGFPGSYCAV